MKIRIHIRAHQIKFVARNVSPITECILSNILIVFFVSALKNCPSDSSNIPTPNIGFSKVILFIMISHCILDRQLLRYKCWPYNACNFSGHVRIYNDDDSTRETVVYIGKCGRISRALNGKVICKDTKIMVIDHVENS